MKHKIRSIHFVGIGGSGMSGIAEVLLNLGYRVSGSDLVESEPVRRLRALGARVALGHEAAHVEGADCVVTSSAVRPDNPEVRAARAAHLPVVARATMLAELMKLKQGVAVAGTHGKTTTTSLVASILAEAGLDPTFVIGGLLNSAGVNAKLGRGEVIVVEADESDGSFLNLSPMVSVVTNIDADHMDTYGHDMARLKEAFIRFVNRLPFYGAAVLCTDDANVRDIIPFVRAPVVPYGLSDDARVRATEVGTDGEGMRFVVRRPGHPPCDIRLALPGVHNVRNALAAIAVADELSVPQDAIVRALAAFTGVGRRFQRHGEFPAADGGSFLLIDDYGHHPAELLATLAAARGAYPGRRLVLVFQPHRYSRTRDLFDDFLDAFEAADEVWLAPVYPAGELPIPGADTPALVAALGGRGRVPATALGSVEEIPQGMRARMRARDVVINMGAGAIGGVPARLREHL